MGKVIPRIHRNKTISWYTQLAQKLLGVDAQMKSESTPKYQKAAYGGEKWSLESYRANVNWEPLGKLRIEFRVAATKASFTTFARSRALSNSRLRSRPTARNP